MRLLAMRAQSIPSKYFCAHRLVSLSAGERTTHRFRALRCAAICGTPQDCKAYTYRTAHTTAGRTDHASSSAHQAESEDKQLEDEEFAALHELDEYRPLSYRLAEKADAFDADLKRIHWVLYERVQHLTDTTPATLTGRPANIAAVLARIRTRRRPLSSSVQQSDNKLSERVSRSAAIEKNHVQLSDLLPFQQWRGTSCVPLRWYGRLRGFLRPADHDAPRSTAVVTLSGDIDYIRRIRALHALNYYSRMNLTPKRHLGHSAFQITWNMWIGVQNALGCCIFGAVRGAVRHGWLRGAPLGLLSGFAKAIHYLTLGFIVSPSVHLSCGLCNNLYGPLNFFYGRYWFDAMSGRWVRCTVLDGPLLRHGLQLEKRTLRAVGRAEFRRKRMSVEAKWGPRLAAMGLRVDRLNNAFGFGGDGSRAQGKGESAAASPYEVLNVKRTASPQQIKQQYKKLAMVFHPDAYASSDHSDQACEEAQRKFAEISEAYQVLSNPEKRRAYDLGGESALRMHERKHGRFMSRTPEEIIQSIFGGEGFRRRLLGELLRSHWSLRYEAQVSVSLHEFEELQCIRVRQVAYELALMADVHARAPTAAEDPAAAAKVFTSRGPRQSTKTPRRESTHEKHSGGSRAAAAETHGANTTGQSVAGATSPYHLQPWTNQDNCFSSDFEERCDRFIRRLSHACFGKELLLEVGEAYVIGAQRFLHIRPFYAPKQLMTRKICTGIDRVWKAFKDKKGVDKETFARKVMIEYIQMEYDNVVADLHVMLRYAVQMVLQDAGESDVVRRRRCYAVWRLGEKMIASGTPWSSSRHDDSDVVAYIQQAANASASTAAPPKF